MLTFTGISSLGLFGITAYNAELRTKEVGIRKVMGASRASLIRSLSLKFMVVVFISVALALPLAFWFIRGWMENFTYQASLSIYAWILAIFLPGMGRFTKGCSDSGLSDPSSPLYTEQSGIE